MERCLARNMSRNKTNRKFLEAMNHTALCETLFRSYNFMTYNRTITSTNYLVKCALARGIIFSSVHRPLLLSKLKSYGFNNSFVNMLNSYLSHRYNGVSLGSSVTSCWKSVVRGCPQGSSLGPLIWNIFQNDLVYNIDANISMYADDHQIYQIGKGISTVHTKLEESASSATDWYENNLLEGNLKKYQTMFIQNKYGHKKEQFSRTEYNTNLNLNGKIIRTSDSLKILGVTIDNKLNFNEHINDVCNKASQRVGVIMRLRNLIPTTAKLVLFKSAILPYLTYCHIVWHFCRASDTRRLKESRNEDLGLCIRTLSPVIISY